MLAEKRYVKWLYVIFAVKFLVLCLFSSHFMHHLFIPFVSHFVHYGGNPWSHFYQLAAGVEFPYNPLMLYILSFFSWFFSIVGFNAIEFQNVALKIPSFLGDLAITCLLIKLFPTKIKAIVIFYAASPIILYAVYMHSQLDMMPTALLFTALFFLKKRHVYYAALFLGFAISVKFHVMAAMPILFVYVLKNFSLRQASFFVAIPVGIYCFFVAPYILSDGFYYMVLRNSKQMMLFDVYVAMENLKVYLPIAALFMIYGRFFVYKKVNNDLLDAFMGMVFGLFVLLVPPAPGWYVWMLPFLSIFLIKMYREQVNLLLLYYGFSAAYLLFFVLCYKPEYSDLTFLNTVINFKVESGRFCNLLFTVLEVVGFLMMYALYKFGVKSNAIYKTRAALIMGIGGDSGAGKSTLMEDIKSLLGRRATELEGDGDHKWERHDEHWRQVTHLNPKANYIHRQAEQILILKRGESISRIHYDHHTGKFTTPQVIESNDVIVLSGLHPFYLPKMRKLIDVKIYLDPDPQLRIHWKLLRDAARRGYTKEKVIEQLEQRKPDAQKYITPQRNFADLIITYFVGDDFVVGDGAAIVPLKLKVTLDSSVRLESIVYELQKSGMGVEWDYTDDLATQYLILSEPPKRTPIITLAKNMVANLDELIENDNCWQDGYRGFVQLIVVLLMSEKMRENGD